MKAEGEIKNRTIFRMGRWSIKSPPPSTSLLVPISVSYIIHKSIVRILCKGKSCSVNSSSSQVSPILLSCPLHSIMLPKWIFLMENFMRKFCDLNKFHWPSCPETHATHYSSFAMLWRYCWCQYHLNNYCCSVGKYISSTFVQYRPLLQCWEYRFWTSCLVIGMIMGT